MTEEVNSQVASRDTVYIPDLYFIFQHEKLGTFKVAQKLQELYRAGELGTGLGETARLLLTFDQRRALRYTARERVIAYRKVFGYSLFIRPQRGLDERNRAFHRLLVGLAGALAQQSERVERSAELLYNNLTPMFEWDLEPLCAELNGPLMEALRLFMSPELCAALGAESGHELVEIVLRRYYDEQNPAVAARSRLADAGRTILRELDAASPEIARAWLDSAGAIDMLPTRAAEPNGN